MMTAIIGVAVTLLLPQSAWSFSPSYPHISDVQPKVSSTSKLHSIPTPIDTFTSGLASIARLPYGVTVSGGISPPSKILPKILKLYDVENDRQCRVVRERITELDLVVENVIPSTSNSRVMERGEVSAVPTLVAFVDGTEVKFEGVDSILGFLDDEFSIEKDEQSTEKESTEEMYIEQVKDTLLNAASYLPGILRAGRGTSVCSAASSKLSPPRPTQPLILYSYEGNQFCRLVREVLTELDITYELRSAGKGSPRREELAKLTGGSSQCPDLIDPNTDIQMPESKDIVGKNQTLCSM